MTDLTSLGVKEIRDGVRAGDFTAREVAEKFNAAVAEAAALNAFIVTTPDHALAAADKVDAARAAGETKWNYWKLWNFAIDGIVSGSSVPLRIWTYAGSTIALLAFLYAGFLVVRTAVYGVDVPGYASIMVAVLLLGGINIFALGILGEYLGRIFAEVQNRPLYLINRNYGIGEPARPEDEWKKTSTAA